MIVSSLRFTRFVRSSSRPDFRWIVATHMLLRASVRRSKLFRASATRHWCSSLLDFRASVARVILAIAWCAALSNSLVGRSVGCRIASTDRPAVY